MQITFFKEIFVVKIMSYKGYLSLKEKDFLKKIFLFCLLFIVFSLFFVVKGQTFAYKSNVDTFCKSSLDKTNDISNKTICKNLDSKTFNCCVFQTKTSNISSRTPLSSSESEDLEDSIDEQLNDIDLSEIENNFNKLSEKDKALLGENSFLKLIKKFINAEDSDIYSNFLPYALSIIFEDLLSLLPYFAVIVAIAILYSLVGQMSGDKSLNSIIHLVCFGTIAGVVIKIVLGLLTSATNAINIIEGQMEAIFPIILTLITAVGGVVTATTFEPFLAILTSGITKLFSSFLIPIFTFSIVFGVVGNLSKNVKLEKFSKFFTSLFNSIVGVVFTIFMAFLALHGLTVSTVDTISIKTTKYAIKNYIPIVGSYLSDGVSLILASSVLIKNAIGVSGLVMLFLCFFSPIIQIVVVQLLLKLTSAILEPVCDKETPDFLYSISKSLNMLLVSLLSIGFMFLISVSILMCCSNLL